MSELVGSHVHAARDYLAERRRQIRGMHHEGATGSEVVAALTVLADDVVARLTRTAIEELGPAGAARFDSDIALVALAGYGRAELAPYSDIDLMFLYRPSARALAEPVCDRLVRDFWDAGLVLGSSMRTLTECLALARRDISVHTALLEARHVAGNGALTGEMQTAVARLTRGRHADAFVAAAVAERAAEQQRFGSNLHLLEPDLKKSRGGLRELHLMRWVAQVRYGVVHIEELERAGLIASGDAAVLAAAREFLLRVRNHLHFEASRAQDTLTMHDQVRLAERFGFADQPGLLGVERFMQRYYGHTASLDEEVARFVGRCRRHSPWRRAALRLAAQRIDGRFLLCGGELSPLESARDAVLGSLAGIVRLFAVASARGATVSHAARDAIREALVRLGDQDDNDARRAFLTLLQEPGRIAPALRDLDALGILERLVPEFRHVKGLIQFNQYHKYTIDEHTFLCIGTAEQFRGDTGPLGQVYRAIHHKDILHLALLLHDLGKGYDRDHSELGREIALRTAERFGLEPHRADLLVFLVHRHLLMAHLAFRRDTSDEQLLARFAREVGTPEVLKMLFVLTAADIAAVGPETWTTWKGDVLADLYARTMEKLSGDLPTLDAERAVAEVRERVAHVLVGAVPADWLDTHLDAMPRHYLLATPPERIGEHLRTIRTLPPREVVTAGRYDEARRVTEYTVYTYDDLTPGLFSKMTAVLAATGLQILGAEITTHRDGVVIDRFEVIDYDYNGEPPTARRAQIGATIRRVLLGEQSVEALFAGSGRIVPHSATPPPSYREPTQVQIDNDTSDRFTILDVFAHDRQGLLYVIAHAIFELGLSVSLAKIATSLDQVLDVFYVTDRSGNKVTDPARLDQIRDRLVQAIEAFERSSAHETV